MPKNPAWLTAKFVNTHYVDEEYHRQHSQLIHRHSDVLELLYIKQGCGSYIVDGHHYFVQPGNLIVCNANILHGETHLSRHNVQSYCCVLQDLQLPHLPPNTLMDDSYNPVLSFPSVNSPAEHIMLSLHELSTASPSNRDLCESLANALLNLVSRSLHKNSADSTKPNTEELIQNITLYLDNHYTESVSLEELGEVFYMSHYYLSHIFKAATGLSPMKYVAQRRIGEAQNLLMNTNISIGEIGERLGFSDSCHFSSTFKRYIGVTPTQYRNHFHQPVKQ